MTLNQLIQTIQTLTEAHGQIKTFYVGDPWEFEHQPEAVQFPAVLCQINTAGLEPGYKRIDLALYFMDLVVAEESNELEVQSDMLEIAADIYAGLRDPALATNYNVSDLNTGPFFTEWSESSTAGLRMDFGFQLEDDRDRCAIPENE